MREIHSPSEEHYRFSAFSTFAGIQDYIALRYGTETQRNFSVSTHATAVAITCRVSIPTLLRVHLSRKILKALWEAGT